ncbi:MAG: lanthionine synthetase LanC family protein [Flavobacterium circumlabens]|uniref:Lanthionine synthetase C-like protein n=1 Tax=Flavobacterium azizsancarii TaxID=2961580 RepID=A0ABT4W9U1_9FLAO|nr:lanthionine synthetase LanC family protein [Flavobacterium azizsancarii]MDA6069334.1 hypothetical protein [Flavobacterium azizsancarii]
MKDNIIKIEKDIWGSFDQNNSVGLYVGLSGMILFYDYLHQAYPIEEYENKLLAIIEKANQLIEEGVDSVSLCSGFAGYGIALLRLQNKSIDIDEEYFETIDGILLEEFKLLYESNNFDFLHESMGISMYFIERYKVSKNQNIFKVLQHFSHDLISKINADFKNVLVKSSENRGEYYSFGAAHGVAGYLNFLIYMEKNVEGLEIDIRKPLRICVDFLMSYKKYDNESKQYFANIFSLQSNEFIPSRLSWCQGDLGISNALYNTGVFLNDDDLVNESISLMNNSSKISFEDSGINDSGFCHGSAGALIQYYLAAKKYSLDYSLAIEQWFVILQKQTNNFEEFLCYDNLNQRYHAENNLLLGSAGIGLTLLTMEKKADTKWLETFNLY